jgi:hypothetical protein
MIGQSLVKKNPRTKDGPESWIVESVDLVEEPRVTVKVLKTRFVKFFTKERNLVTGFEGGKDRMNCNPLTATLYTQTRVNYEDLHRLTAQSRSQRAV